MTFNGKNKQPRKSSTNTRALSTRLQQLQREMNPQVMLSGSTLGSQNKQFVTRKLVSIVPLSASTAKDVLAADLGIPDGCKILKIVAKNLSTRQLRLNVPTTTGLLESGSTGTTAAPFGGIQKYQSAPLSRFPTLVLNVPDLLAAPQDLGSATVLFTLNSGSSSAADVELTTTVRYTV